MCCCTGVQAVFPHFTPAPSPLTPHSTSHLLSLVASLVHASIIKVFLQLNAALKLLYLQRLNDHLQTQQAHTHTHAHTYTVHTHTHTQQEAAPPVSPTHCEVVVKVLKILLVWLQPCFIPNLHILHTTNSEV